MNHETPILHAEDSERALLGAIMLDPDELDRVLEIVLPSDMSNVANRAVLRGMQAVYARNQSVDLSLLAAELKGRQEVDAVGGYMYLAQLEDHCMSSSAAVAHARLVRAAAVRRRILEAAREAMRVAQDPGLGLEEVSAQALSLIAEAATSADPTPGLRPISEVADVALEQFRAAFKAASSGQATGWSSGLPALTRAVGDFPRGACYAVVAARPSNGKTAFLLHSALNMAKQGATVGIFSLEMGGPSLVQRLVASEGIMNSEKIRMGTLDPIEFDYAPGYFERIGKLPIYIDDSPCNSPARMRARIRQAERRIGRKFNVIGIDYIQITDADQKTRERHREVAIISKGLQTMARECDALVMALCQLGRDAEGSKPTLAQLRESGAIEQDADIVLALHRNRDTSDQSAQIPIEAIVLKNRHGRIGEATLQFHRANQRFH